MTLALLLTAASGAWADISIGDVYKFGSQIDFGSTSVWRLTVSGVSGDGKGTISGSFTLGYGGYNNGNHQLNFPTGTGCMFLYIADDNSAEPWGIQVSGGDGSYENPYTFSAIYEAPLIYHSLSDDKWIVTMPAGNVTVEPEYFPQAALTEAPTAINDVPATTDGAIVKVGTVANIGSTETAQGTVMYYVSQTALDDDALLALDADQWKADVPTAESLAEGQAYVYYYVRGNDSDTDEENFSDGDILAANALNVTIAAEPTYNVTFADGVNPEPPADPEWTASPNTDVKKGQTVTVTYTGTKKVIGVKAEKKGGAAGKPVSEITPDDIFKVIASNGIIYDNIAAAESAGTVAQGLIVYVGSNTGNENYKHGLALALNDENNNTQGEAINACNAKNTSTPIVDALWILPSQGQWNTMFNAAGGDWKLRDCFSSAGGNNMVKDGEYWSSTGDSEWVWYFMFSGYDWEGTWGDIQPYYNYSCNVRACIVF